MAEEPAHTVQLHAMEKALLGLSRGFTTLGKYAQCGVINSSRNFGKLTELNNRLVTLNHSFVDIFSALQLNASSFTFPKAPPITLTRGSSRVKALSEVAHARPTLPEVTRTLPPGTTITQPSEPAPSTTTRSKIARPRRGAFPMKRILSTLPDRYQNEPYRGKIETVLRSLRRCPEGLYLTDLVSDTMLPKLQVNQYLNVLMRAGHVLRQSKKGLLYTLNQVKFF